MQRDSIIGLAIVITLAVLAPQEPAVEPANDGVGAVCRVESTQPESAGVPIDGNDRLLAYPPGPDHRDSKTAQRADAAI